MGVVDVRGVFGRDAASMESVRAGMGVARPASVRALAELYVQDVVFRQPVVTDGGVALGGEFTLAIARDGGFRFQGSLEATGLPSYDVAIVGTVEFSLPVPDSAIAATGRIAFTAHGRAHGSNEPGDRVVRWDQTGSAAIVGSQWAGVRRAQLSYRLDYDTDWFGSAGDVVSFVAQLAGANSLFGATGAAIVLAGEAAQLLDAEQLVLPGLVGVIFAAGAAFALGPGVLIPAFIVGAAATSELVKQRHLEEHERAFADSVFQFTVPFDRVLLTNLVGLGNRPFTTPAPGGTILVNIGAGFDDPVGYTGKGGEALGLNAPGQLLIHELTHAWQIANESFTPEYYCRAVSTAVGTLDGDMSAYRPGPPDREWSSIGTEAQASIVDQWFAGSLNPDTRDDTQRQYPPMHHIDSPAPNPYYHYIRDHIRTRIA